MIERYSLPEMEEIWSLRKKYEIWFKIEETVAEVQAEMGIIPKDVPLKFKGLKRSIDFDVLIKRSQEIEKRVKHDVISFVEALEDELGPLGRYIHFGLTSSDLLDTALAIQMRDSLTLIIEKAEDVLEALEENAKKYKDLPVIGRTHGVHAEPTTLGLRFLGHASEFLRELKLLKETKDLVSAGKLSGAVGNYSFLSPQVESKVLEKLGLKAEPVSTQIVPRDRHTSYFWALSRVGAACERFSVNLRLLSQTEIQELLEPFGSGQKGSSAMPHKRNPILSERLTGLSRLLRGYLLSSMENTGLWLERDISHSSVERFIFPDASGVAYYMLNLLHSLLRGLDVNREKIKKNLSLLGDRVFSQALLLSLIRRGAKRQDAYRWVQEVTLVSSRGSVKGNAGKHTEIRKYLSKQDLEEVFSHDFLKYVDSIFERYFEERKAIG